MTRSFHSLLLTAVLALAFAPDAHARGLTPWDVARLSYVTSTAVSPDGARVAYTVSVPRKVGDEENGPNWTELHLHDLTAGVSRPFVTGKTNVSDVQWVGGSHQLAFLAKRDGDDKRSLYLIDVRGGEARRVLAHDEDVAEYAFDAAGRKVAFLAREPKDKARKDAEKMGFDAEVYEEEARPQHLYLAELDLADWRARGEVEPRRIDLPGHAADLQYSPTGGTVLLTLAPTSLIDDRYMDRQWVAVDLASGAITGRIETRGKLGAAAFSPDGRRVAFVGPASIHDPAAGRLMVASAAGGAPVDLLPAFEGHVDQVDWVDAKTILFRADVGTGSQVATIPAAGGAPKTRHAAGEVVFTQMSASDGAKVLAFAGESARHPGELFVARAGQAARRVTVTDPWLSEIELGDQNVIRWKARDGLELEGILIAPVGYEHGRRHPLIVYVHGGPEAHESNGWKTWYSRPGQMAAARGYFVFCPNYRGSTGRGYDFTLLSQGDPAGKEFDDIVDGVDHLIDAGLVDPTKVGITGGSYGGFATAWGATRYSDRYAAAVMFVGVSEQYSKFGTTDIPRESQLVHQNPRKVYNDWEFFLDRSPIRHAKGSKTPLLILHGKDDPRVHPTQSLVMYRYFQHLAEAPVRLVWYPGEGHGNRKAAAKLDYSLRMLRWMDHFLLEGGTEKPPFPIEYEEETETGAVEASR